jgi:hypothetical protein
MTAQAPIVFPKNSAWAIRAASMPGARHLADAGACEDAFSAAALSYPGGEVIALFVADGAGSALRAAEGAAVAAGTAMASARRRLAERAPDTGAGWRDVIRAVADDVLAGLWTSAEALGCLPRDLGCTLGVALLSAPWLAMLMVGDAFGVVRRDDRSLHVPLNPLNDGVDPSHTVLLPDPDCLSKAGIAVIEDPAIEALALSSDGLARSALLRTDAGLEPYAPFLHPVLDGVRSGDSSAPLARFLLMDKRVTETTDDDRTLVMAVRR